MATDDGTRLEILFYFIIGFFLGLYWFYRGFYMLRLKRLIENIPTSKIRSIAMGLVEVYGEVVPRGNNFVRGPFSGRKCLYYKYEIDRLHEAKWVTTRRGSKGTIFYIRDETGSVLVDPKGAESHLKDVGFGYTVGDGKQPPEFIKDFLVRNKIKYKGALGRTMPMRFSEYCINPGDKIYLLGNAGDNPFIRKGCAQSNEEGIIIRRGRGDKICYLSKTPERKIIKGLEDYKSHIVGGAILSIICLLLIIFFGFIL